MTLFEYMEKNDISDSDFGALIGARRQSVWRYKTGHWPRQDIMEKIVAASGGHVTPNDWMPAKLRTLIKKAATS